MKSLVFVVAMALSAATPVPSGTTTARYSLGGRTHVTYLPQSESMRIAKQPKNESFYTDMVLNILTQSKFRGESIRKIKRKDQQLLSNFVKSNFQDLNTPNSTMKIKSVNRVKIISTTGKPKRKPAVPSNIVINVSKPVNVSSFKKTVKVSHPTNPPFKIKLSPRPVSTIKYHKSTTKKPKTKPTVRRVVTKWSDKPTLNEIKQAWYEEGVPYPNPNPEISSNSPSFSLSDVSSLPSETPQESPPLSDDLSNAVSTFNLDMSPDATNIRDGANPCPSVHISSSVLNPQQRQECSDLSLVINSHFHQNTATDRTPPIQTYDAPQQADPVPPPQVLQDGGGGGAPAAGAPGGTGGVGGSGGSGGNGGNGDGGGLKLPDLKGLADVLRFFWEKFGHILRFFMNPYLYIVPMVLFFLLGFLAMIGLFPWWIPALFLFVSAKTSTRKKSNIAYYKHVHKPLHHYDGWFWNHETKTWQHVAEFHRRVDDARLSTHIPEAIENFSRKYRQSSTESWKWRRRNR